MKVKKELDDIASGIIQRRITVADNIPISELEKVFPTLMDITLRDAAAMIEKGANTVFEWNSKKDASGTFKSWDYLTDDEWNYVDSIVKSAPKKNYRPKNKRRFSHGNKKRATN